MKSIIKIKEDVKVGNIILEKGDKIKILEASKPKIYLKNYKEPGYKGNNWILINPSEGVFLDADREKLHKKFLKNADKYGLVVDETVASLMDDGTKSINGFIAHLDSDPDLEFWFHSKPLPYAKNGKVWIGSSDEIKLKQFFLSFPHTSRSMVTISGNLSVNGGGDMMNMLKSL